MSNIKLDFHFHSLFSDGSKTVEDIFKMASEQGVKALALTDHDTVLGILQECEASDKYEIPYIPAAEFTAQLNGVHFHVLGYGIDPDNKVLQSYSREFLNCMNQRSLKQIHLMQANKIDIDTSEFFVRAGGGPLYRAKLLGVLADFGYLARDSIMALLTEYFAIGKPYYLEDRFEYRSLEDVSQMIHQAGGIAVLAHPGKIKEKNSELYYTLLQSNLLDGFEVYHPQNKECVQVELLEVAKKRELIYTGGTDYHGRYMKNPLVIGDVEVPVQCFDFLKPYLHCPDKSPD